MSKSRTQPILVRGYKVVLCNSRGKPILACADEDAAVCEYAKRIGGIVLNSDSVEHYRQAMVRAGWSVKSATVQVILN